MSVFTRMLKEARTRAGLSQAPPAWNRWTRWEDPHMPPASRRRSHDMPIERPIPRLSEEEARPMLAHAHLGRHPHRHRTRHAAAHHAGDDGNSAHRTRSRSAMFGNRCFWQKIGSRSVAFFPNAPPAPTVQANSMMYARHPLQRLPDSRTWTVLVTRLYQRRAEDLCTSGHPF
jgi:hypothetical protein